MMGMQFLHRRITSERVRLACRHWTNTGGGSEIIWRVPATGPQRLERGKSAAAGRLFWPITLRKVHFSCNVMTKYCVSQFFSRHAISTWLHCLKCCILTLEMMSNHIPARLCCQVTWNLPEAGRINNAGLCPLRVNRTPPVEITNQISHLQCWASARWPYAELHTSSWSSD